MPASDDWLEVRVDAPAGADEAAVERLEDWLTEAGALSVTALDAEALAPGGAFAGSRATAMDTAATDTAATLAHAVLEPAPGETPLWRKVALVALFAQGSRAEDVRAALAAAAADVRLDPVPVVALRTLADAAWERVWMEDFRPMRFGPRFVVSPHHLARPDGALIAPDDVVLALDPGLAFGTGTHATTAQCLEWLGRDTRRTSTPFAGRTLIDYGCGSGVLGIAALLLGAERVRAVDIDPQALEATLANARANGVADRLDVGLPDMLDGARAADVLVANILQGPLAALAPTLGRLVKPGGALVMSGVLTGQSEALRLRYTPAFEFEPDVSRDGWALLTATRRPQRSPGAVT